MITLECKAVLFYSAKDEASFFAWAESIPGVSSVFGRGQSIYLLVRSRLVSDRSLRELISLFQRYRISMRQLAQFRTEKNQSWFAEPHAFWFRSTFGPTSRSTRSRAKTRAPG
jgi:hypothetical protein